VITSVRSLNGKILYSVAHIPLERVWKMVFYKGCNGCTGFSQQWDKDEHTYNWYCEIFGVWHTRRGSDRNQICKANVTWR
jgi:hypothetical protein